ncbi:MAG: ribulose-phosphate 3-epimerase [Anaerolineae bacterium]|jgi:ribulose-phosphate 3-epimerase
MVSIEASILSADFARLGEQAREAEDAGVDAIQIDVMDGSFVPDITFGPGIVGALRSLVSLPLDVHLMIVEPERHLEAFAEAGADRLIVHQESTPHLHRTLQTIRELGIEAGVSVNPATPLVLLEEVLDLTDLIQVMTVNPGWGGQAFLHSQLDKIRRLEGMLGKRGLEVAIGVDGGIDPTTAPLVVEAGATMMVSGSSIYNDRASVRDNVAALRQSVTSM